MLLIDIPARCFLPCGNSAQKPRTSHGLEELLRQKPGAQRQQVPSVRVHDETVENFLILQATTAVPPDLFESNGCSRELAPMPHLELRNQFTPTVHPSGQPPDHTRKLKNTQIALITQSSGGHRQAYITPQRRGLHDEQTAEPGPKPTLTRSWEKIPICDDERTDFMRLHFMTDRIVARLGGQFMLLSWDCSAARVINRS